MSSRYGERGYGRYGEPEDDRTEDRFGEREADRARWPEGGGYERGTDYGISRRGGHSAARGGGYEREYGQERGYDARDLGTREYGSRYGSREYGGGEYGSRYGREVLDRGGYAPAPRRHEGDDRGRDYGSRVYGRDRALKRDDDADEVREYDTDYGRTTSRFYGRSGYEYGRDDYDDDRDERGRRGALARGRDDDDRDGGSWLDRAADQVRSWFGGDDEGRGGERHGAPARGRGDGQFRGRGPKNYRRSDDRLREEVCDRLTDNEWLDASDVEVNVAAGEVILTGTVDSRYAKRLAENIAESVSGVHNVQNNLRVQSYQAGADAPVAGMDTPLPAANAAALPPSDITATTDTADADDAGHPSSKAAGQV
jgi:osmotically-inducible protein OsmY